MILLINYALNKLDLYFVVLFDSMSDNLGILCFHGDIVINTGNDITYNGGIYKFLIVTLDMSLKELFRIKLHKFKTKDQSEKGSQLQGRCLIFGRDAIALIFKLKLQFRT